MRQVLSRLLRRAILAVFRPLFRIGERLAEEDLPKFANAPKNLRIEKPRRVLCEAERVFVGDDVWIGPGSLLMTIEEYPSTPMRHPERPARFKQVFDPRITIGNRVTSTGSLTISAMQEITIEDDVMLASNVFICDGLHGFENADEPYRYQKMGRIAPIKIKRGCWVGQNVVIMPGVTIGELSIVGANSVVTRSIPPRSIAVGAPARVIKKWDESARKWIPVVEEA
jgi:acetyltransferase-like isoleucine patch superfamily enzyme